MIALYIELGDCLAKNGKQFFGVDVLEYVIADNNYVKIYW